MGPGAAPVWSGALGGARLLLSGFGKWGGGLYDLTTGVPEALDDLPSSGLGVGGGRLWRVLRAPGEQTSACELLSYDELGARSYERLDDVRDPHDVCWFDGAVHIASSWDDTVWRLPGPTPAWRLGRGAPDGWHVNSLTVVDGALHACAFGRYDRHKAWKDAPTPDTGFVVDLGTGRTVLGGLAQPHTPRRVGDRWFVCESLVGTLTECAADGTKLRRAEVKRFTRGLEVLGDRWALVGGNGHRDEEGDRAEVAVVDLATMQVVDRIALPCTEVYDIVAVPAALARGAALGFGANTARAVDQHRATERPESARPTPPHARVLLAAPGVASALAGLGRRLPAEVTERCGIRGRLPARVDAGSARLVTVEVVNRSRRPLASVAPRVVKVAARWIPVPGAGEIPAGGDVPAVGAPVPGTVLNPTIALPRVVRPGDSLALDLPLEAPDEPGRYEVRVALGQQGMGWFGVRLQAQVDVVAPG